MSDLDLLKLAAGKPTGTSDHPDPPSLERIAAVFPQLEILELLGVGGMGAVYKARQKKLDRLVALKILADKHERQDFRERFEREGRLLARLNHPNIVAVYDFGESDGFFYLLMEYVEGVNLRQAMRSERFTPEQALAIIPEICDALSYAHDEGILHRDIKPENILLDTKGRIKIADFGIGKLALPVDCVEYGSVPGSLTQEKEMLGTPFYAAPEQLESAGSVDHRADIYSLGVVFYELLTGELPIGRFAPPSEKSNVNRNIDPIVLKSLEKEREKRQQSAEQLKAEVENVTKHGVKIVSSGRKPDRRLVLTGLLFLLLAVSFPFMGMSVAYVLWLDAINQEWGVDRTNQEKEGAEIDKTFRKKYGEIENKLNSDHNDFYDKEERAELRKQLSGMHQEADRQMKLLESRYDNISRRRADTAALIRWYTMFFSVSCSLILGVLGTIFGWIHLNRIRCLSVKPGYWVAFVVALLAPVILLWGGSLVLFTVPYPGGVTWTIGNLVGLATSIYLIRTTYLWANTPVADSVDAILYPSPSTVSVENPVPAPPEKSEPRTMRAIFVVLTLLALLYITLAGSRRGLGQNELILLIAVYLGVFWIIYRTRKT